MELFTFISNWDWTLYTWVLIIISIYLWKTGPGENNSIETTNLQKCIFLSAAFIYYFALGSPLNLLAHESFSMHMLQMSLLYFVVPPLFLLGIPKYFLDSLNKYTSISKMITFFTRPIVSIFFFNGLLSVYHFPFIFDSIAESIFLHIVSHGILFFGALCMWWPIIIISFEIIKPLYKLALIFANGILITPACAIITFTNDILFSRYNKASALMNFISPIHDQQFGGIIMKIMQEIVYIGAIIVVIVTWIRREKIINAEPIDWKQ